MAKVTFEEAIADIKATTKEDGSINYNRFNKKKFEKVLVGMFNDPEFSTQVAVVKNGELDSVKDVQVTHLFRLFLKGILEKAGVDKKESEIVLSSDFTIDKMSGMYEFFTTAIQEYMNAGNRFDFIPKSDFKASIAVKTVPESKKVSSAHSPKDRQYLGDFEITKKEHKVLIVKSSCPSFLRSRVKVK